MGKRIKRGWRVLRRNLDTVQSWLRAITPGKRAWRSASWGALIALLVMLVATAVGLFGPTGPVRFALGLLPFIAVFLLFGAILTLIRAILKRIPTFYFWVLTSSIPVLALMTLTAMGVPLGVVTAGLGMLFVGSLLGAAVTVLARGWREATRVIRGLALAGLILGCAGLTLGGFWLLDPGSPLDPLPGVNPLSAIEPLDMADPSLPGPYAVRTLTYGSGTDHHRPEYGADVALVTHPVDGSALVESWSGLRTAYWGFGPEELPLNGRVWLPEGTGPFPLVMILHGQHPMEDFSDTGYAYLGDLLASRGFIVASVDENFLNLSPLVDLLVVSSLKEEDDLRGWLLLEHLREWRAWNTTPGNPLEGLVDLDNVALIGHSRGGEAVAIAAALNRLTRYPEDATLAFDYNFGIRSVVAFAPVDGMYSPGGRETRLENVNYLVLQGAHDMDVFTFYGASQYERVDFTGEEDWFKAGLYIRGANHGQFNTVWGRKDLFEPVMRVFNLEQLLPGEEQRQVAKVAIGAFLEATLHDETGYVPLFQDRRLAETWLPATVIFNQFQDAHSLLLSTYEEDTDAATTTLPGGRQDGAGLAVWREGPVRGKTGTTSDHAVVLGWDTHQTSDAAYQLELPEAGLGLGAESVLVFELADAAEDPTPETPDDAEPPDLIDLTIEVVDGSGNVARLPLSHFAPLLPQIEGRLGKAGWMSVFPSSEAVFQHFECPLADFVATNSGFDPAGLLEIRFLFDRTPAGAVVLDDVGMRQ